MFTTIAKLVKKGAHTLFPSLKKNALLDQIKLLRSRLNEKSIPAYEEAYSLFGGKAFKSPQLHAMDKRIKESLGNTVQGYSTRHNMVLAILLLLRNSQKFVDSTSKYADKIFGVTEPMGALKLRQAYILSMVNTASFAEKFSRQLLNYIYAKEMVAISGSTEYDLVKGHELIIEKNFERFVHALRVMNRSETDISKALESLSEYADSDEQSIQALMSTQSISAYDPLRLGYMTDYSPFYILGMWEAEVRAWFVNQLQDEIELLTRRRIRLEQLYANQNDAYADKEIDAIQQRLDDSQVKMDEYERKYGFNEVKR